MTYVSVICNICTLLTERATCHNHFNCNIKKKKKKNVCHNQSNSVIYQIPLSKTV